jgi:hypothetical protein
MPRAEGERKLFASSVPLSREVVFYAVATLAGSTIWLWPHLVHFSQVPDRGDPIFSAWRLARFAHQLATDPKHLFDGNIFYPLPLTLTYSDATILQGVLGAPLIWIGVRPLIVSNLLFFVAFPACGLAFFYVAWQLTRDPRAALVAGLLGAWYSVSQRALQSSRAAVVHVRAAAFSRCCGYWRGRLLPAGLMFGLIVSAQWLASITSASCVD